MINISIPENIWQKRGVILEDYVFYDLSIYQLCTKHRAKRKVVEYLIQQYEATSAPVIMQIEAYEDEPNIDNDTLDAYIAKHKMMYLNRKIFIHGGIDKACKHMHIAHSVFYDTLKDFKKTLLKNN